MLADDKCAEKLKLEEIEERNFYSEFGTDKNQGTFLGAIYTNLKNVASYHSLEIKF